MRQRLITFNKSELGTWDELLSCNWLVTRTSEGDEHLLIGDIAVTDAIKDIQFEVSYRDTHREPKDLILDIHQTDTIANWKKFEKHFENCLKKVLKASDAENKLFALKSFLWNKMANELIKTIKAEKEPSLPTSMVWYHTFKEPFTTYDGVVWGNVDLLVDFSESTLTSAATRWFTTRTNYGQADKDDLGNYLLYYIYGTLTYKYSIPTNPDLINYKVEEMSTGSFLSELEKHFSIPSRTEIKASLKAFLIDKFWIADYRLPPTAARILQELEATKKQKEQIANEFEMLFKLSSFPIDNYVEESKLQTALNSLKRQLRNFNVRTITDYSSVGFSTIYEVTCDFLDYRFTITLNTKNKYVVDSFEIKVESEGRVIFNTVFTCCEGNVGEFAVIMSQYLGDVYLAKAFKRHIEYKIERSTGCEITWRS